MPFFYIPGLRRTVGSSWGRGYHNRGCWPVAADTANKRGLGTAYGQLKQTYACCKWRATTVIRTFTTHRGTSAATKPSPSNWPRNLSKRQRSMVCIINAKLHLHSHQCGIPHPLAAEHSSAGTKNRVEKEKERTSRPKDSTILHHNRLPPNCLTLYLQPLGEQEITKINNNVGKVSACEALSSLYQGKRAGGVCGRIRRGLIGWPMVLGARGRVQFPSCRIHSNNNRKTNKRKQQQFKSTYHSIATIAYHCWASYHEQFRCNTFRSKFLQKSRSIQWRLLRG